MQAIFTFSPSDSQFDVSSFARYSSTIAFSVVGDESGSFVDISYPDHHSHPIPRPSSPSSSSLSMNRTDSTESYVNIPNPDRHPYLAHQSFSSSVSRVNASPNISIDENSLSVHEHAFTTVMD
jgi:hypothetical protein